MTRDIKALYQAVERTEHHLATHHRLLDYLAAGHRNAPDDSRLKQRLAREIAQAAVDIGALQAERDRLRQQISDLRTDYARRGWQPCTQCGDYKPPDAFPPDARMASGRHSHCRACRADWIRERRKRP